MEQSLKLIPALFLCLGLSACGTDSSSGEQGSTLDATATAPTPVTVVPTSTIAAQTTFTLRLTDAPIDGLTRVVIQFTSVELKRQSGGWVKYTFITPRSVDMLQLQGTVTADLLANVPADPGDYEEIRFFTDNAAGVNFVEETTGGIEPLQIPGGSGSGLRLIQDFTISPNLPATWITDLDLRQSIRLQGGSGNYRLEPVWRLASLSGSGHIRGVVNPALLIAPSCSDADINSYNAAYVFNGHNVAVDDINQSSATGVEPLATTAIRFDLANLSYIYEAAYLPAGNYTIALTCNADLEDLDADDNLQFFNVQNATVLGNNTVFLN